MRGANWTDANQDLLVTEFRRIKTILNGGDLALVECELAAAREAMPAPAAIDVITDTFELSAFERDVLLLSAGVELDAGIADECTAHNGVVTVPRATFALALAKLPEPHWSALTPIRPLRASRLLQVRDSRAITSSCLDIEERVLHFLAGVNYLDPRLSPLMREQVGSEVLAKAHEHAVKSALKVLKSSKKGTRCVQLVGDDPESHREVARRIAEHLGFRLYVLRGEDIPASAEEAEALVALWHRESKLLRSALLICINEDSEQHAVRFLGSISGQVLVSVPQAIAISSATTLDLHKPLATEQKQLWTELLGERAGQFDGSLDAVAAQFRLGGSEIASTARALRQVTAGGTDFQDALWNACRATARSRLDELAQRVEPVATWGDLVVPEQQTATLRQIVAHARQRLKVYEKWGFKEKSARGLGISVLFSGESGTGKTMAAEVLANELRLDLYRIDLATVVSKYIGETEKNLRRVFDAAEKSGAILLFDEADALFGKRSEVRNSQDRFANIEVSYLLQRMEAYRGLAILTTNLKEAIDSAFLRRLRFIVQFPFPDQDLREHIWRGVFPASLPTDSIDYRKLAQLNVAGGNIRNIALNAAFLAADSTEAVNMAHLLQAARSEATKRNRPFSDAETRGWA